MPYRSRLTEPVPTQRPSPSSDRDLLPIWGPLWVAATSRVAVAILHRETFRAEATLALMVVAVVTWLVLSPRIRNSWRSRAARRARCRLGPSLVPSGRSTLVLGSPGCLSEHSRADTAERRADETQARLDEAFAP